MWVSCVHHLVQWEGRENVLEYIEMMCVLLDRSKVADGAMKRFLMYFPERPITFDFSKLEE